MVYTNLPNLVVTNNNVLVFDSMSLDNQTKATLQKIPLLTVNAGPRDGKEWEKRLKEEYSALIKVYFY